MLKLKSEQNVAKFQNKRECIKQTVYLNCKCNFIGQMFKFRFELELLITWCAKLGRTRNRATKKKRKVIDDGKKKNVYFLLNQSHTRRFVFDLEICYFGWQFNLKSFIP